MTLTGDRAGQHSIRINDQWLDLQTRFDLEAERDRLRHRLAREVQMLTRAG